VTWILTGLLLEPGLITFCFLSGEHTEVLFSHEGPFSDYSAHFLFLFGVMFLGKFTRCNSPGKHAIMKQALDRFQERK